MIETEDVLGAVNLLIKTNFPNINRVSKDLTEGFKKPAFFIEWDDDISGGLGEEIAEENFILRIFYFPQDGYINQKELLDVKKALRKAIGNNLKINEDFYIPINELNFRITDDKVLVMDAKIEYWQDVPEEDGEFIEELEFTLKREE